MRRLDVLVRIPLAVALAVSLTGCLRGKERPAVNSTVNPTQAALMVDGTRTAEAVEEGQHATETAGVKKVTVTDQELETALAQLTQVAQAKATSTQSSGFGVTETASATSTATDTSTATGTPPAKEDPTQFSTSTWIVGPSPTREPFSPSATPTAAEILSQELISNISVTRQDGKVRVNWNSSTNDPNVVVVIRTTHDQGVDNQVFPASQQSGELPIYLDELNPSQVVVWSTSGIVPGSYSSLDQIPSSWAWSGQYPGANGGVSGDEVPPVVTLPPPDDPPPVITPDS